MLAGVQWTSSWMGADCLDVGAYACCGARSRARLPSDIVHITVDVLADCLDVSACACWRACAPARDTACTAWWWWSTSTQCVPADCLDVSACACWRHGHHGRQTRRRCQRVRADCLDAGAYACTYWRACTLARDCLAIVDIVVESVRNACGPDSVDVGARERAPCTPTNLHGHLTEHVSRFPRRQSASVHARETAA